MTAFTELLDSMLNRAEDATDAPAARAEMPVLIKALKAVGDEHVSKFYDKWGRDHATDQGHGGWCRTCGQFAGAACPTIAAVLEALEEGRQNTDESGSDGA